MNATTHDTTLLSDFDGSRRNNFTALRILFAWLVLFGHSFPITGHGELNPLREFFERSTWIGEIAVSGFFAISGFLVAASFVRRGMVDYCISRVLRIYPALIVCVCLSVVVLGASLTTLERSAYFSDPRTWNYFWNTTAMFPMSFRLPGVFDSLPRPGINGSLWTLPVEVSCYILLMFVGATGLLRWRTLANLAGVALLLFSINYFGDIPLVGRIEKWAEPCVYFLLGVGCYINRVSIPLSVALAVVAGGLAYAALGEPWFPYVFPPAFVYLIFFAAYRSPYLDLDRWLGDPSYGIYIYAWPVQQTIVYFFPEQGPYFNTALATIVVVLLALMSWHFLEKPALGLKRRWLKNSTGG
ncbi:acyltransferase [Congregibacter brevis]|uniref:Acyltransferase n=1 Tax=Congregibacter brevis TaxID=3081201 RepID=A0ABZ0ICT5_9GAMM|nr:acyltransferase [Congregibacter sp. IMCC45268]